MAIDSTILWTVVTVVFLTVGLVVLTLYYFFRERKDKPIGGRPALLGEIGVARTDLDPEGRVLVHGEWWNARADERIPEGTKIRIIDADKMMLKVERAPEDA